MKNAKGITFKYPDNVDTDVIIPARYLNSQDAKELAQHCMEDIDKDFVYTRAISWWAAGISAAAPAVSTHRW